MKRALALILTGLLCFGLLLYSILDDPGPTQDPPPSTSPSGDAERSPSTTPSGPAVDEPGPLTFQILDSGRQSAWTSVISRFSESTGIPVQILTEAQTEPPIVVIGAPASAITADPQPYLDLSTTTAYAQLASWDLALTHEAQVCGIPYRIDCMGLLCNTELLAAAGYSPSEIDSFAKLQEVVKSITAMGLHAFATPDPKALATQLASLPADPQRFLDLYLDHTGCSRQQLSSCAPGAGLQELRQGKAVFCLGSTTEYFSLSGLQTAILPVYLGLDDELGQTLCVSGSSYICVRSAASSRQQQQALEFIDHLVLQDDTGKTALDRISVLSPFRQSTYWSNPLGEIFRRDLSAGKHCMACQPSSAPAEDLTAALLTYATAPTPANWQQFLDLCND